MRRTRILLLIVVAAVATVVGLSALAPIIARQRGGVEDSLDGAWRSRGYGWIWQVEDGQVTTYEESGALCLKNTGREFNLDKRKEDLEISPDRQSIRVLMEDDQFRYAFDRIGALPGACTATPKTDPLSVFDAAVETLSTHYAFFDKRNIDWNAAVLKERSKITAATRDLELFKAISRLLSNFHDSHVSLEGEIGDDELQYYPDDDPKVRAKPRPGSPPPTEASDALTYWNPRVAGELLDGTGKNGGDDAFTYGIIDGDIGYLAIRSMSDYSRSEADRLLRKAMNLFEGTTALIIDVSVNDGGYDMTARNIAAHFAEGRALGYYKYPGDYGDSEKQAIYVEPSGDDPYDGPIFLITGPATVSAAEIFVLSMRALPNVTQIGEPTNGSLSDILSKPLPNGWSISLSNEVYLDAGGVGWEGLGIPPAVSVNIQPRSGDATRRDIAAARRVVDQVRAMALQRRAD